MISSTVIPCTQEIYSILSAPPTIFQNKRYGKKQNTECGSYCTKCGSYCHNLIIIRFFHGHYYGCFV